LLRHRKTILHDLTCIWKLKNDFMEVESEIMITRAWKGCRGRKIEREWVQDTVG
jgi:hypothetical protein